MHQASRVLGCRLRDLFEVDRPEQVWVESYLDPTAHPNSASIKIALLLRGAVDAVTSCYDIPLFEVDVSRARIAFCGKATAVPPRKPGSSTKSSWQAAKDRIATKQMIWNAAVHQGYFDAGQRENFDMADSVCVWSYAACKAGRTPPLVLV